MKALITKIELDFRKNILKQGIFISFFAYIFYVIYYSIIDFKTFFPFILSLAIFSLIQVVLFILEKRLSYSLLNELFIIFSIIFITILTYFIIGPKSGVQYFILIFALLALSIANPKNILLAFFYFIITMVIFSGAEFGYIPNYSIIDFPEYLVNISRIQCIMVSFVLIFYLSYLFYRTNQAKEKQIITQNQYLAEVNAELEESQQQLSNQHDKLVELNNELQSKLEFISQQNIKLEEANKTKEKFYSIIAHDLKNPLGALVGLSEALKNNLDEFEPDKTKKVVFHINDAATSLNKLLLNLLQWSQAQTGKIQPRKSLFNLIDIVDRNKKLLKQNLKEKNISLENTCHPENTVECDKAMIETVVRNLLTNAIKFTHNNGTISISDVKHDGIIKLQIKDTGIGMTQEKVDILFSLDKSKLSYGTNNEKGLGLGLIICKDFLKLNNCSLTVESEENVGSTFTITFPKA